MTTGPVFTSWTKSSRSGGGDNCVEVAFAPDGSVGVRHSKNPAGPVLVFTESEYTAYVEGILMGELRFPAKP